MADDSFVDSPFYSNDSSPQSKRSSEPLGHSLLSEDKSSCVDESFASALSSHTDSKMMNGSLDEVDEYEEDSFVVADTPKSEDTTFDSINSASVTSSSPVVRRVQPARFAKHDLNTPVRKRRSAIKREPVETSLENSLFDNESNNFHPAEGNSRNYVHPALINLGPEERALMLELYPEMAHRSPEEVANSIPEPEEMLNASMSSLHITPRTKHGNKKITTNGRFLEFAEEKHVKTEDDSDDGRKYNHMIHVKTEKLDDYELVIEEVSADEDLSDRGTLLNDESEDSFEQYLRSLRKAPQGSSKPSRKSIGRFVVDDTEAINDFPSEFETDDDEGESELTDEEDSSDHGDESLIEVDNENSPITCIKPAPKQLATSLLKSFRSPSLKKPRAKINDDDFFISSLSENFEGKRHLDADKYIAKGLKSKPLREELTAKLFDIFHKNCFNNELGMVTTDVSWNVRLTKTAGYCKSKCVRSADPANDAKIYESKIELSVKVITTAERLRDTLVHEMCHAATFLIDKIPKAGHGPLWESWAAKCRRGLPSLEPISRCHNYQIHAKYQYECSGCGQMINRHSKSFDITKYRCGKCKGEFVMKVNHRGGATASTEPRKATKFALFVKENYGSHKKGGRSHKEVMGELSNKWKSMQSLKPSSQEELS